MDVLDVITKSYPVCRRYDCHLSRQALISVTKKEFMAIQPGDVEKTWANVDDLIADYAYHPNTKISDGIFAFVNWYKTYFNITS